MINEAIIKTLNLFCGLTTWRIRELKRSGNSEYKPVPPDFPHMPDHFCYVADSNNSSIAFTENDKKGAADIQTVMRPGRYLKKFFPDLTDDEVRQWSGYFVSGGTILKIYTDPDECLEAYRECDYYSKVSSCMTHSPCSYETEIHPMMLLFNHPDISVGILYKEGIPVARALLRTDTKVYPMIYGEHELMIPVLKSNGYSQGDFDEMEFDTILDRRSREKHYMLMPYIDGRRMVGDRSYHNSMYYQFSADLKTVTLYSELDEDDVMDDEFSGLADGTSGRVIIFVNLCDVCGSRENTLKRYNANGERVCQTCAEEEGLEQAINSSGNLVWCLEPLIAFGTRFTDSDAAESHGYVQEYTTGKWVYINQVLKVDDSKWYFKECFDSLIMVGHRYYTVDYALEFLSYDSSTRSILANSSQPLLKDLINSNSLTKLDKLLLPSILFSSTETEESKVA